MSTSTAPAATPTVREYRIPASLEDAARAKVAQVNRRLAKLGLPLYQLSTAPGPVEPEYDRSCCRFVQDGVPSYMEQGRVVPCPIIGWNATCDVTITGAVPRLADWEPVATLTRDQDGPVITRVWPDLAEEPDLRAFRDTDPVCEHCNTRRVRRDTYVVRHVTTGQMVQVGRTCLAAFTGIDVRIPRWLAEEGAPDLGELGGFSGGDRRFAVAEILETTCQVVAKFGWTSRTVAQESMGQRTATADLVMTATAGSGQSAHDLRKVLETVEVPAGKAAQVLDYARTINQAQRSEYADNLATIANGEWVTPRNLALLCSAVSAYDRAQQREVERVARGRAASEWVGEEGQRLDLVLTVVFHREVPSDYTYSGLKSLVGFADADGNRYKWWASDLMTGWEPGDLVTLRGTVKGHEEYQGTRETVIFRCKIGTYVSAADVKEEVANA